MALTPEHQAILQQKGDEYVASMEQPDRGVDYSQIETDRLLILEAINDWSGRVLGEGGDIQFTYGCDDSCCATEYEVGELVRRLHKAPPIAYPVSGFSLSEKDELRFSYLASSFRMKPHTNESRSDGIGIAEARHIRDVEAAMQLWVFCATEDCMAYLYHYMESHGLELEGEERVATRRIITSSLQEHFSIGQIWNAMWRSVKDAAALSTRQYYNNAKAAKTIPKKIDKVLLSAFNDPRFEAYDRIAETPLGAVLTLFSHRFGVNDATPGAQVRAKLAANAAAAPPEEIDEEDSDPWRSITRGTMFFRNQFTELDQLVLSCFKGLRIESDEPEWDDRHAIGRLRYSLENAYAFDGMGFINKVFSLMRVQPPSTEDVARHAAAAKEENAKDGGFCDESGWTGALSETLVKGGVDKRAADRISWAIRYRVSPDDIVGMIRRIPVAAGLCAIRVSYAHVDTDFMESSDRLHVDGFTFAIPEENLEPNGCDVDVVIDVTEQNFDRLAGLIAESLFFNLVSCENDTQRDKLLTLVANKLLEQVEPRLTQSDAGIPDRS